MQQTLNYTVVLYFNMFHRAFRPRHIMQMVPILRAEHINKWDILGREMVCTNTKQFIRYITA